MPLVPADRNHSRNKRTLSLIEQARPATEGQPVPCLERGSVLMNRTSLGSAVAASVGALWSFLGVVFLGDTTDNRWQIDPDG